MCSNITTKNSVPAKEGQRSYKEDTHCSPGNLEIMMQYLNRTLRQIFVNLFSFTVGPKFLPDNDVKTLQKEVKCCTNLPTHSFSNHSLIASFSLEN